MPEFLIIMRADLPVQTNAPSGDDWHRYTKSLEAAGCLRGGSNLGDGQTMRRDGGGPAALGASGFLKLAADTIEDVRALCHANPDYLAGATLDIFPLLTD
jgi:hypothetical protein